MKRLLLAGSAALVLTLGASACGAVQPNAAVVNGKALKARDIEADVAMIVKLNAEEGTPDSVRLPAAGVRSILAFEVLASLFENDAKAPVVVDQAAIDAASGQLAAPAPDGFGEKWTAAPAASRDRLAKAVAVSNAAQQRAGDQATYDQMVLALVQAADVKINPRYGVWDPNTAAVVADAPVTTDR